MWNLCGLAHGATGTVDRVAMAGSVAEVLSVSHAGCLVADLWWIAGGECASESSELACRVGASLGVGCLCHGGDVFVDRRDTTVGSTGLHGKAISGLAGRLCLAAEKHSEGGFDTDTT